MKTGTCGTPEEGQRLGVRERVGKRYRKVRVREVRPGQSREWGSGDRRRRERSRQMAVEAESSSNYH